MPRIVWQGFTHPIDNKPYVDRLVAYLNEVADPGYEFVFAGISPPDVHVHRLTELRCSVQAVAGAIQAERDGIDGIVLGHFQDAGLRELRTAVGVPVVGLGEASMLYACQLGYRFGLITIHPNFTDWHEEQVRSYGLWDRCAGVRAMTTTVDLWMRAFAGDEDAVADTKAQFEAHGRELAALGAEVLIPAGGLPALLFGTQRDYAIDGAVVLNANAIAAKLAEVAVKMKAISGTAPSRMGTYRPAPPEALDEFVELAARLSVGNG